MKIIFGTTGKYIGTFDGEGEYTGEGSAITMPEGFEVADAEEWFLDEKGAQRDHHAGIARRRTEASARIRSEAAERIAALDWRLERAGERATIGAPGETTAEVLREREAIRAASNRAVGEVEALDERDAILAYRWEVTDADRHVEPRPRVLGKGEFLDLFVQAGAGVDSIRAASEDPALADFWWALDRMYSTVRRGHPSTIAGVEAMVARKHVTKDQADAVWAGWPLE